jgi:hypothetical protein
LPRELAGVTELSAASPDQQLVGVDFQFVGVEENVQTESATGAEVGFLIQPPLPCEVRRANAAWDAAECQPQRPSAAELTQGV